MAGRSDLPRWSVAGRWLLVAGCLAGLAVVLPFGGTSGSAAAGGVIPAGREALVAGFVREALGRAGFRTDVDIGIDGRIIKVKLARNEGPLPGTPVLVVGAPGSVVEAPVSLGGDLGLACAGECPSGLAKELAPLSREMDSARRAVAGRVWQHPSSPEPAPEASLLSRLRAPVATQPRPLATAVLALWFTAAATAALFLMLRASSRRQLLAIAAVTVAGGLLRVYFVEHQLMGVQSWQRDLPWLWHLKFNGLPILALVPDGANLFDQAGHFNLLISLVLPVVIYAHARTVFAEWPVALLAAALFAVCPLTAGFARSEELFISNILFSSLAMIFLFRAVTAESRAVAFFFGLSTLLAHALAIDSRPLSLFLCVAFVPAIRLYSAQRPSRVRAALLLGGAAMLVAVTLLRIRTFGRASAAPGVSHNWPGTGDLVEILGLLPGTLLWKNNYLGPTLMPLWITVLALAGLVLLFRRARPAFWYVVTWFAVIYSAHGLVGATTPLIAARYGLHSVVPLLFLAAFGLHAGFTWLREATLPPSRRGLVVASAALFAVVTTLPASGLLGPVRDDANAEYAFLRELAEQGVPEPGAVVVESYDGKEPPRFRALGTRVAGLKELAFVQSREELRSEEEGPVYLYQGLPCLWRRTDAEHSPRCVEALKQAHWVSVARRRVDEPLHDASAGRLPAEGGEIVLYRLAPRRADAGPADDAASANTAPPDAAR